MALPTDRAQERAALGELVARLEPLIHSRLRGVAPLAWSEETVDHELVRLSALVRPARAHSGGVTVRVYHGGSIGLAVGPSELTFRESERNGGLDDAVAAIAAAVTGGARVEVFERWWRTSTRIALPAYGAEVAKLLVHSEFPGYPVGTHFVSPALITDTGRSGAVLTHSAAEVAIGTATAGARLGARVSVTDTGAFWFQWDGPEEHQYADAVYEAGDLVDAVREYASEIEWDWMDPAFAALADGPFEER